MTIDELRTLTRMELAQFVFSAPEDELYLLRELVKRIESGRRQYGAWVAEKEDRNLTQEEHEEHLDGLVYSSMRRVRNQKS